MRANRGSKILGSGGVYKDASYSGAGDTVQ